MISINELTQILTVLVSVGLSSGTTLGENDNCQLQESTVPITRHLSVTHGGRNINVICTDNISLNKCEGTCESSVTPSVRTHPGFRKNCRCCKETTTVTREVMLTCYRNGQEIPDYQQQILVRDITGCQCQTCTD